jgi:uncharacterized membrane protein required for colicin V production
VNIGELIGSIDLFDLLFLLGLFGFFILGFLQGTIRRLLDLLAIGFSFLISMQLRGILGDFLAQNWTQFPAEYSVMLAFLFSFVVSLVILLVLVQAFYKPVQIFVRFPIADEVLGGVLAMLFFTILIGAMIVILDSFFALPGFPIDEDELGFLRSLFDFYDLSATAGLFRDTLIPWLFALVPFFVPEDLQSLYPRIDI